MIGATTIPVPATTPPMSVTIHAVPVNGGSQTTITIDKTGPDMGRLITNGQSFNVFNVQASPDGEKLVCNTQYLFCR